MGMLRSPGGGGGGIYCIELKSMNFVLINELEMHLFSSFLLGDGGDPFQPGSWSERPKGCSNFKTSPKKPSDKCQRTHIVQISIHET